MEIEVLLFGPLREPVGEKTLSLSLSEDATVEDALGRITAEFPNMKDHLYDKQGKINENVVITRNKVNINQSEGSTTTLSEGDTLRLSPPVTGGASSNQ